jgi:competence protein ComEC
LRAESVDRVDRLVMTRFNPTPGNLSKLAELSVAMPGVEIISVRPAAAPESAGCESGDPWQWDGVQFEWIRSQALRSTATKENKSSCALRISLAGRPALLLATDLSARDERSLALSQPQAVQAEVMVLSRQGSRSSNSPAWLDAVKPTLAIVSVGAGNRHAHPDPAVLTRLAERKIEVLRTDRDGAIDMLFGPASSPQGPSWSSLLRWRRHQQPYWRIGDQRP